MTDYDDRNDSDGKLDPDTAYSPASERETESRQDHPASSPATNDPDVDEDAIKVLPGTGGPDDPGDVDLDDEDFNLPTG